MFPKRVLLVEDDPDTREITALLLQHAGYTVIVAHDIASGVAESEARQDFGVIVTDMYLGRGQTGISLIRSLRDSGSRTPIVLTSAHEEASIAARDMKVLFLPSPSRTAGRPCCRWWLWRACVASERCCRLIAAARQCHARLPHRAVCRELARGPGDCACPIGIDPRTAAAPGIGTHAERSK
ncbi:response regulator [Rhodanobacter sp. UC4437_H4]